MNQNLFLDFIAKNTRFFPLSLLMSIRKEKLILPFYHTISNSELVHIKHLYRVKNVKQFEYDLEYLLKFYNPIALEDFKRDSFIKTKKSFLLTFDDGLSEIYHTIAPILIKKGIPATFFLNSNFIDNKDLFFRYKASILINKIEKIEVNLQRHLIEKHNFKSSKSLKDNILNVDYFQKDKLDSLALSVEVDFDFYLKNTKPYLDSNQIKSLQKQNFTFGAHSVDHPEYQFLPLASQIEQTENSLNFLKSKFDLNYSLFSFPFTDYGVSKSFFNQIAKNIDFTFGCAGFKNESIQTHFQRIAMEKDAYSAEEILKYEHIYYFIKMFLGKNEMKRRL